MKSSQKKSWIQWGIGGAIIYTIASITPYLVLVIISSLSLSEVTEFGIGFFAEAIYIIFFLPTVLLLLALGGFDIYPSSPVFWIIMFIGNIIIGFGYGILLNKLSSKI